MIELRSDYLENLSAEMVRKLVKQLKADCDVPLLITCRDKEEGGSQKYPLGIRAAVLAAAVDCGADLIDFEYRNFGHSDSREKLLVALANRPKARLILSAHNFEGRFENIGQLYRKMTGAYSAAIPKLVYMANHINDCFEAFDLLARTGGERIVLCMGQAGVCTRILAGKLGTFLTFASLSAANSTAAGQVSVEEMKKIYNFDSINEETEVYGVIGSPVGHSISPAIHNVCFGAAGLNKVYLPLLVDGGLNEFSAFMQHVLDRKRLGFKGFSVTIPHKQNAIVFVRKQSGVVEPLAERIGAANTVLIDADGRLAAYNTDYRGAMDAILEGLKVNTKKLAKMNVAVVGAGGVARAIAAGLVEAKAGVKIYNRTAEKAKDLAAEFGCGWAGLDESKHIDADLLINCTSVGMSPNVDAMPVSVNCLNSDMAVFDTIYNPAKTLLLKEAENYGAKTISGLEMFVGQAAEQFKLFTGQSADKAKMRKVVCDCLGVE